MPATIPSHQAAILPLKVCFPDRFDGVALVIASTSPDIGYVLTGIAEPPTHVWHSLLWFHLPVGIALTWLARRAAPAVATHLPGALREYAVLDIVRHPLWVTAYSAVLGALTHQVWDCFTHPGMLFLSPNTYLPALDKTAVAGLPWWQVTHLLSEIVGSVITLTTVVYIARRHLLVTWHGQAPERAARPLVFWPVAILSAAAAGAAALALPGNDVCICVIVTRWLGAIVLGLATIRGLR